MWRRKTLLRLIKIQRILVRHGLDEIITATHMLRPLRFLFYLFPRSSDISDPLGKRLRMALIELGPIFIKFGQAVSTRRDLLSTEVADELAQSACRHFPQMRRSRFWTRPMASPSTKCFPVLTKNRSPQHRLHRYTLQRCRMAQKSSSSFCVRAYASKSNKTWMSCLPSPASPTSTGKRANAFGRSKLLPSMKKPFSTS